MTNTRPRVVLDGHYSITETASLLQVHPRTIQRWVNSGYMKKKTYRHSKRPFIQGFEIIKIFNACN